VLSPLITGTNNTTDKLVAELLRAGGTHVLIRLDPYNDLILSRGQLHKPETVHTVPGKPKHCHANTSLEYLAGHPNYKIVTGYAMSGDYWLRHSWLQGPTGLLLETASNRDLYYGVVLNDVETARFVLKAIVPMLAGVDIGLSDEGISTQTTRQAP
jgi:hypothetical protein